MSDDDLDIYELRERGFRVLDVDQCCLLACSGGACETCPCCQAGWCVTGVDDLPNPVTDAENYAIWLDVAAEHNPTAKRLAAVEAHSYALCEQIEGFVDEVLGHGADTLEGEINRLRTIISRIGAAAMESSP